MHPELFKIGPLTLRSYGLAIAIGVFIALFVTVKEAKRLNESPNNIYDLFFYVVFGGLITAHLTDVIVHFKTYLSNPIQILNIGLGLVFFGGLIGGLIIAIIYMKIKKLPIWKYLDILVLGVPIAHAFGRIGCFMAGCCFGAPSDLPWAVTFTDPKCFVSPEYLGIPLHPVQLYESFGLLILFIILMVIRKYKQFDGQLICLYGMIYPVLRYSLETIRNDPRGFIFNGMFSTSQFISIFIFITALIVYIIMKNKYKNQIKQVINEKR